MLKKRFLNMKCYIDYLSAANNFKQKIIEFENYESAVFWAKDNLGNFSRDQIKFA